jgi:hypothetical protein
MVLVKGPDFGMAVTVTVADSLAENAMALGEAVTDKSVPPPHDGLY